MSSVYDKKINVPKTPDEWLDYYNIIKEKYDIDLDFFEDAPDDLVYQPDIDEGRNQTIVETEKEIETTKTYIQETKDLIDETEEEISNTTKYVNEGKINLDEAIAHKRQWKNYIKNATSVEERKKFRDELKIFEKDASENLETVDELKDNLLKLKGNLKKLNKSYSTLNNNLLELESNFKIFIQQNCKWENKKFPKPDLDPSLLDDWLIKKIPSNFCLYPFVYLNLDPDGRGRPCCKYNVGEVWSGDAQLPKQTIQELFDQEYIHNLRKDFLLNKKNEGCKACWDEEKAGIHSMRQLCDDTGKVNPTATWFEHITKPFPTRLDFKLSSICNQKCRICSPFLSSKWLEEFDNMGEIFLDEKTKNLYKINAKEKFLNDPKNFNILESWLKENTEMAFFGGEPLLQAEHKIILKKAATVGHAHNILLFYNTNGSIYGQEIIDMWKKFRQIMVCFSIDDIGERFEYQRFPASWSDTNINIRKYLNLTKPKNVLSDDFEKNISKYARYYDSTELSEVVPITYTHYITLSIFNIFYLDEILLYSKNNWRMKVEFNQVHFPHYFSIQNIPLEMKDVIRDKLRNKRFRQKISCLKTNSMDGDILADLDRVIQFMYDSEPIEREYKTAFQVIHRHDKYRKQSFRKVFPELSEFLK